MKSIDRYTPGFTLIEILLYLAISLMLIVVISSASIDMLQVSRKTADAQQLLYAESNVLAALHRVLAGAYEITTPSEGAVGSSLSFTMYDLTRNPSVFTVVDDIVYLKEGTLEPMALHASTTQTQLVFTDVTPDGGYDSIKTSIRMSIYTYASTNPVEHEVTTTLTLQYSP